jgi:hypothetical protein
MKSTILLSTALFLLFAPTPDSKTLAEISMGFLKSVDQHVLLALQA